MEHMTKDGVFRLFFSTACGPVLSEVKQGKVQLYVQVMPMVLYRQHIANIYVSIK